MFNELIFLASTVIVVFIDLIALRLGKSFLLTAIITQGFCSNIFILKEVSLFGLSVTCTDVFIIGILLALNLLEEFYGKEESDKAISSYIFSLLILFLFKFMHLWYTPTTSDNTQEHYIALFSETGRIILATLFASFISLKLDRKLYQILSKHLGRRFLPFKNFITSAISQFFDTVLFSYLALYGIFANIWELILFSYLIKMIALFSTTIVLEITRFVTTFWVWKIFVKKD